MNKTVSATQARKEFFKLMKFAGTPGASVIITLEDNPPVVMMSQSEFEGWMETMEIMSDPELMKDIKEGMKEMKAGKGIPLEEVMRKLHL